MFSRVLGLPIGFTSSIEEFIAHKSAKMSYGKQPLGSELFFQSHRLLLEQGIESIDITVKPWEETVCFFNTSTNSAVPFDVFSAAFYLLSRYEEYLPYVKDTKGRYSVTESLAFKNGFLEDPVVDIWSYKLKRILQEEFPLLHFEQKKHTVHLLVDAQEPYAYIQKGFFKSGIALFYDLYRLRFNAAWSRLKVLLGLRRDPYDTFKWIIRVMKNKPSALTVFFLLGEATSFEKSVNSYRVKFRMLIKLINDYREVGLLISKKAVTNADALKSEKRRIEASTKRHLVSSLNFNLEVSLPEIYRNLLTLEIEKDFTMVYEDMPGFRAGTCTPFLFYDLDYEIKTPLILHAPVCTTSSFKRQSPKDTEDKIKSLLDSVKGLDGSFIMIFANKDFAATPNNKKWRSLFSETLHQ